MKVPFLLEVPDFQNEVEKELKPDFYTKLSESEKHEYIRNLVSTRATIWACRTGASAYNLCVVIMGFGVVLGGSKLWELIQSVARKFLGVS